MKKLHLYIGKVIYILLKWEARESNRKMETKYKLVKWELSLV